MASALPPNRLDPVANKATQEKAAVFFSEPQGRDIPRLAKEPPSKARLYHMTVVNRDNGKARAMPITVNMYLDSQQPQIHISKERCIGLGDRIIFPLQDCELRCGIEGDTTTLCEYISDEYIEEQRAKFAFLEKMPLVALWQLVSVKQPLIPFLGNDKEEIKPIEENRDQELRDTAERDANWRWLKDQNFKSLTVDLWGDYKSTYTSIGEMMNWALYLQERLRENERKGWWYYQEHAKLIRPNAPNTPKPCPPWLLPVQSHKQSVFHPWKARAPWFIDGHERRSLLIEGALKERHAQIAQVHEFYSYNTLHRAQLQKLNDMSYYAEELNAPEILPGTTVKLLFVEPSEVHEHDGEVSSAEAPTDSDLVILVNEPMPEHDPESPEPLLVMIHIRPSFMPIDAQLAALDEVSHTVSYGDRPGNFGQGFSLKRTLLAHGSELGPRSPYHFVLDATTMSKLDPRRRQERVDHVLEICRLDENQSQAFWSSVTRIVCGISLVQGPPRVGETRTSTAVILALACLGIRVVLTASSNAGVDNLTESVGRAIESDHKISSWVGEYGLIRLRAPARQISEVHVSSSLRPTQPTVLDKYEMHNRVMSVAEAHPQDENCRAILDFVAREQHQALDSIRSQLLNERYGAIVKHLADDAIIIAAKLTTLGYKDLDWLQCKVLLCAEAAQCAEGEVSIAMKLPDLRAMILVGDPSQPAPPMASETVNNECALWLKGSLMGRLQQAGYPCTVLT
ncbi:AAA domain-containing protein [Aspergillus insuetus]